MKFKIYTLGCKVNSCDSGIIAEILKNSGFEECDESDKDTDINIINTCAVTAESERKSRQLIRRVKNAYPESFVIACGCWSRVAVDIERMQDTANVIISHKKPEDTAREILRAASAFFNINEISDVECGVVLGTIAESKTRAALKIQDGCNRFCTYCIIPYARAALCSVPIDKVVSDVNSLVDAGFNEVVLTGIHIASYNDNGKKLIDVIEAIDSNTSIKRIRLGSLEPKLVTNEFVDRLSNVKSFCPHFHLSLQSGSTSVLERMNRRYTAEEYLEYMWLIRDKITNAEFTTDIIVGFPGETEDEFSQTMEFVKKARFTHVHIFPYSKREGTPAAGFPNQLSRSEKHERVRALSKVCDEVANEALTHYIGRNLHVLTERKNENGNFEGYSENYIRVEILSGECCENEIHKVAITGVKKDCLCGKIND